MIGLVFSVGVLVFWWRPDLRLASEVWLHAKLSDWRKPMEAPGEVVVERVTAVDLSRLSPAQARVSRWLAVKYGIAPEPMAAMVLEAYRLSSESMLPAHLILAVAAMESNFHPYIQSHAGAQGLMQVMPQIHRKRYEALGEDASAFDPLVNMRVGVSILKDFVRLKEGSIDEGLKAYLGGMALAEDGGYVAKVRAEEARLDRVAGGEKVDP